MVLHKPYPAADEARLVIADHNRKGDPTLALLDAAAAFQRMKSSATSDGIGLIAFSAYRSVSRQRDLFIDAQRRHGPRGAARWVAPPGYSEHQTGLAFDIGDTARPETDDESEFESTTAFAWLRSNAAAHGFELSFPPGNRQNVAYEPWHWRFSGSPGARAVFHPTRPKAVWRLALAFSAAVRYQLLP